MIKKIVFKNLNTSLDLLALGKVRFFDNYGNIIESGNVIKDTNTEGETENFRCVVDGSYVGSYPANIINLFDTTSDNSYWISNHTTNVIVELYFKKFIDSISKLSIVILPSDYTTMGVTEPFDIDVYDYGDILIQSYHVIPNVSREEEQTVNTYELMKYYTISNGETMYTLDTVRVKNINKIFDVMVEQDEPIGTTIRYLFSIDGRNTWFSIINGTAQTVDKENVLTNGMSKDDIEAIDNYDFGSTVNLDVLVGLRTTDIMVTPIIHKLSIKY